MRSCKFVAMLVGLLAGCVGANIEPVAAQDNSPVFTMPPVQMKVVKLQAPLALLQTAQPLTQQQERLLFPQQFPVPGLYAIETVKGSKCLTRSHQDQKVKLILSSESCSAIDATYTVEGARREANIVSSFLILPQPEGGHLVKMPPYERLGSGEVRQATLLSAACFVVDNHFENTTAYLLGIKPTGPYSILSQSCTDRDNRGRSSSFNPTPALVPPGSQDNALVQLNNIRANIWEFQMAVNPRTLSAEDVGDHSQDECWALRNGSADSENDLIRWSCNDQEDQQFKLVKIADLPSNLEVIRDLNYFGWFLGPEGYLRLSPVAGVRVTNLETYDNFATDNDKGMSCAKVCLANGTCRAFTWKAAGYDASSASYPKCELKRGGGEVTADSLPGTEMSLYSGVVRP